MMGLTAMPGLESGFVRPSRKQQKYGGVDGIGENLEATETCRVLNQSGAVQERSADFVL
jgi:hypothetical protein